MHELTFIYYESIILLELLNKGRQMSFVLIVITLYLVNSLIRNPKKLIAMFKRKKAKASTRVVKPPKYVYRDIALGRFKIGKLVIQSMLKGSFMYASDACLLHDQYKANFILGLENYMLYRFPNADINEVNKRLNEITNDNLNYWLQETKSYIRV